MFKSTFLVSACLALGLAGCGAPLTAQAPGSGFSAVLRARDVVAPAGYYDQANGKTGPALLKALNNTIVRHKDLGYNAARDIMFAQVDDLDNDDLVIGVYSGHRGVRVYDRVSGYAQNLNAEHTWPQSLGAVGPAKADLHHLFPADVDVNGKRSSFPMGEVVSATYVSPDDAGLGQHSQLGNDSSGTMVWEPRNVEKGNVARALLYFYTCYAVSAQGGGPSLVNFRHELPLLAKWSQLDPVDDLERARNGAVYEAQGNRNPYIDHPEFIPQVGDFLAL